MKVYLAACALFLAGINLLFSAGLLKIQQVSVLPALLGLLALLGAVFMVFMETLYQRMQILDKLSAIKSLSEQKSRLLEEQISELELELAEKREALLQAQQWQGYAETLHDDLTMCYIRMVIWGNNPSEEMVQWFVEKTGKSLDALIEEHIDFFRSYVGRGKNYFRAVYALLKEYPELGDSFIKQFGGE